MAKQKQKRNKIPKKPKTRFSHKTYLKILFSILVAILCMFLWKPNSNNLASVNEDVRLKVENVSCSSDYKKHPIFAGCTPTKVCGRGVRDGLISKEDALILIDLLLRGMEYGGSSGGASILDLHSGALSQKNNFVNIYKFVEREKLAEIFTEKSMKVYKEVKEKIKMLISDTFGLDSSLLHLTSPTFFSKMTSQQAATKHDEYWHSHIDKIQYGSFDYTSLLYLSTYKKDFEGGRFIFDKDQVVIEPALGRVSFFTSGSENPHHVEKVENGTRLALTVAFTCDPSKSINDPQTITN